MGDFKLSAQLSGHEQDVRSVRFPKADTVLTASRDKTVRIWRRTAPSPPAFDDKIVTQGTEFINSLAFLPPSSEHSDGLVISGARDGIIDVRLPGSDPSHDSFRMLIGHSNNVCTLDVSPDNKYVVSGGWDGQARVWSVAKWETELVLEGHGSGGANEHTSIWDVLAYDDKTVITGCADHVIRGYDLSKAKGGVVQPSVSVVTPDIVRALCRLSPNHPSGADIASAGNDGVIRLWKLQGQQVAELHGHESFIYSLDCLPSGELVSSGEDRTVRIWRNGECVQTITHPAISVWAVAVCQESGDIVSGASDRIARIFTRSPERVADAENLRQFEESVQSSAIPQQQMPAINKEKLLRRADLSSKSGSKDGQTIMVREDDGSVSAHQWSLSGQKWVMIGTVVDAPGSSGRKVEYQGKSYDFVFDVDIEDGKPPLKLPYNLSENPYERATKFLGDNELPLTYLDSVAQFIVKNTEGATIGQGGAADRPAPDAYGTENRYLPGQSPQQPQGSLPSQEYVTLLQAKFAPIEKKIKSLNSELIKSGQKQYALNPQEEATLAELVEVLTVSTGNTPSLIPASSASPPPELRLSEEAIALVLKLVINWPYGNRLPGLDLLRCMGPSAALARHQEGRHGSILDIVLSSVTSTADADVKAVENSVMMALRTVANLFASEPGRDLAAAHADSVVSLLECVVGASDSLGDLKGPVGLNNRNVLVALTSVAINYSVLAAADSAAKSSPRVGEAALSLIANILGNVLTAQTDSEVAYRALAALGNIASLPGDANYRETVKSLGAEEWVKTAQARASEDRVRNLAATIARLLR